jgi:transcriptional regulator with XRE-family HTH domain
MTNKDLRAFREEKGLSQSAFAELLGISQPAISSAEAKPDHRVSNRVFSRLQETFPADQNNNNNDPEMTLKFSVKLKQSQLEEIKKSEKVVDLTNFFTLL